MLTICIPNLPWAKVGSDIFEYKKKYYLILVDYFSNYVEVNTLSSIGSRCVIGALKEQFCRHGIPRTLVTDNGPAYNSREFKEFLKEWEITQITSSPLYAQSNGKSERTVRTVKQLLKKCTDSGQDYRLGLLNLRTTPRDGIDSPAQMLMGRRLNTRLPIYEPLLTEEVDNKNNYCKILSKQAKQKANYDKCARIRDLPQLHSRDRVVVADGSGRRQMKVVQAAKEPRSYILEDAVGRRYRRNRRHIVLRQTRNTCTDAQARANEPGPSSGQQMCTSLNPESVMDTCPGLSYTDRAGLASAEAHVGDAQPSVSKHIPELPGQSESKFVTIRRKN